MLTVGLRLAEFKKWGVAMGGDGIFMCYARNHHLFALDHRKGNIKVCLLTAWNSCAVAAAVTFHDFTVRAILLYLFYNASIYSVIGPSSGHLCMCLGGIFLCLNWPEYIPFKLQ